VSQTEVGSTTASTRTEVGVTGANTDTDTRSEDSCDELWDIERRLTHFIESRRSLSMTVAGYYALALNPPSDVVAWTFGDSDPYLRGVWHSEA
jgi:hypothetical protein